MNKTKSLIVTRGFKTVFSAFLKKLSTIVAVTLLTSVGALGQGYVTFVSTKASGVYFGPDFYPNTNSYAVPANSTVTVGFMWAYSGIPLVGINGTSLNSQVYPGWVFILGDPVFQFARNANTGGLVSVAVNNSGIAQGGWDYNGAISFPLQGSTAGSTIECFAVAWPSAYATPQAAAAAGSFLGYSALFNYATGSSSGSSVLSFAQSGMPAFQIWVPEPSAATLLVAGLACWSLNKRRLPRK